MQIFETISGQQVRQLQDAGINNIEVQVKDVEPREFDGADSFTSRMWSTSLDSIERWVKDWAYHPELITISVQ